MAAQDDSIKARMTCIGQSNLCASAEYVHFQCTHQPIHGAHVCSLQVIQRSLLLTSRAVVVRDSLFYRLGLLQVMRAFVSYIDPLIIFYGIYTLHFIEVSAKINTTISCIEFLSDFPRKYHERTDFDN